MKGNYLRHKSTCTFLILTHLYIATPCFLLTLNDSCWVSSRTGENERQYSLKRSYEHLFILILLPRHTCVYFLRHRHLYLTSCIIFVFNSLVFFYLSLISPSLPAMTSLLPHRRSYRESLPSCIEALRLTAS